VTTADGIVLRYGRWPARTRPSRGTVVILQGRAEFIEKYFETVGDLQRRGFAAATFDWRGQGGSTRLVRSARKGHVDDFDSYVRDLQTVLEAVVVADCPPPYFILGHSTGASVALLHAAGAAATPIERMILTAPLLGLARPQRTLARLTTPLARLGLGRLYVPGRSRTLLPLLPFESNPVTSDPQRYRRAAAVVETNPSLGVGSVTIGWVHAARRAFRTLHAPDFAARLPMPVLALIAGRETIVSNSAIEAFSARIKTVAHVWIPGAKHEILMERERYRGQFWAAFDAFIANR
jgi:lysophospholipase